MGFIIPLLLFFNDDFGLKYSTKFDTLLNKENNQIILSNQILLVRRMIWFGFYDISTIVGYLMPNPFYSYKQLYFKQFSLT